ncbi:MAG: DUF898 domain-containing protein [Rhodocyclaceae bacterium]|nr:DUF898 domain-containing protein [Rhodocyclaceae bacterium]
MPHQVAFTGSGGAYFRIWIVNLLLSVLTLGIYSAWAKVRRERYFLNNTLLAGSPFEYHADPMNILKGRLLAAAAIIVLSIVAEITPILNLFATLIFLALLPWMVSRSMRFRAHNTSWRGLRFGFSGTATEALRPWLLWPVAVGLSLGLLMPFMIRAQWHYLLRNLRFGNTPFSIDAPIGPIYRVLIISGLWFIALAVAGAAAIGFSAYAAMRGMPSDSEAWQAMAGMGAIAIFVWLAVAMSLIAPWIQVRFANLRAGLMQLGPHGFASSQRVREYYPIVVTNWLLTVLTLGLFRPFAVTRVWRYRVEHFTVLAAGELDSFVAEQSAEAPVVGSEAADLLDIDLGF